MLAIGSGCGATAIAAKMSGALRILANDIDPSKCHIFEYFELIFFFSSRINIYSCSNTISHFHVVFHNLIW